MVECFMRLTYDDEVDAAYLELEDIADGTAVENVAVERPGRGDIILDFDADGRLLGVEVIRSDRTPPCNSPRCCRTPLTSRCLQALTRVDRGM